MLNSVHVLSIGMHLATIAVIGNCLSWQSRRPYIKLKREVCVYMCGHGGGGGAIMTLYVMYTIRERLRRYAYVKWIYCMTWGVVITGIGIMQIFTHGLQILVIDSYVANNTRTKDMRDVMETWTRHIRADMPKKRSKDSLLDPHKGFFVVICPSGITS